MIVIWVYYISHFHMTYSVSFIATHGFFHVALCVLRILSIISIHIFHLLYNREVYAMGCIRKLRQLICCLAALSGNDFAGRICAGQYLTKLISDRLLSQRSGLMIYKEIQRTLVITKQIFNYYNTNFSLEITSKVEKVG